MTSAVQAAAILEERTGHRFLDLKRLDRALTHSSVQAPSRANYERLEFLGDRVLGLTVAEMLFDAFPEASEGELSVRLNALVNAETCAAIADEMGLAELIHTGSDIKSLNDKRLLNVRADVVEALIATIYLDGGLEAVRPFVKRYWKKRSQQTGAGGATPRQNCRNGHTSRAMSIRPMPSSVAPARTMIRCLPWK